MSQGEKTDLPYIGHPEFDLLLRESQAWLAERGEMVVGSGSFESGRLAGAIHSDFGPADQDKETNQDYALAWWPSAAEAQQPLRFVLALADGLTTSFRSECASALACWVAVRALVENIRVPRPADLARLAFNEAGAEHRPTGRRVGPRPGSLLPRGPIPLHLEIHFAKGRAVSDHVNPCLAGPRLFSHRHGWRRRGPVARLSRDAGCPQATDRVLATCDLESQQVYALGPAQRRVRDFDCWHEEKLNGPFLCASPPTASDADTAPAPWRCWTNWKRLQAAGVENPARRFIEEAIQQRPKDFDDNLTLAVIRAE